MRFKAACSPALPPAEFPAVAAKAGGRGVRRLHECAVPTAEHREERLGALPAVRLPGRDPHRDARALPLAGLQQPRLAEPADTIVPDAVSPIPALRGCAPSCRTRPIRELVHAGFEHMGWSPFRSDRAHVSPARHFLQGLHAPRARGRRLRLPAGHGRPHRPSLARPGLLRVLPEAHAERQPARALHRREHPSAATAGAGHSAARGSRHLPPYRRRSHRSPRAQLGWRDQLALLEPGDPPRLRGAAERQRRPPGVRGDPAGPGSQSPRRHAWPEGEARPAPQRRLHRGQPLG